MSANVYSVADLLIGKTYNSSTLKGEIISAEKSDLWYDGAEAYLVQVQPQNSIRTTYRTVAVKVGE